MAGVSHSRAGVGGGARAHPAGASGGRLGASRQPQVLSQCGATAIIMLVGDTYTLINYVSFINYLCYGVTILGLLLLRWRRPALHRPIKVRPWDGWPCAGCCQSHPCIHSGHQGQVGWEVPAFVECWALLRALCALRQPFLIAAP